MNEPNSEKSHNDTPDKAESPSFAVNDTGNESRWLLIRDLIQFQLKLIVDGLRDLLLVPISLVAGLAGLIIRHDDPAVYYNRVLKLGRRSERWINLFGQSRQFKHEHSIDQLFGQLEDRLKKQHAAGGLTKSAKKTVDQSLTALSAVVTKITPGERRDSKSSD